MTTIEYKGKVYKVEAGRSAVVRCEGDRMEGEVIVTAGAGGECTGKHVIEVDELPTEDIDETAVYKIKKSMPALIDIALCLNGNVGTSTRTRTYYYVQDFPTEGTDINGIYYVVSDSALYSYDNDSWAKYDCVAVEDTSQITADGLYAIVGYNDLVVHHTYEGEDITVVENGEAMSLAVHVPYSLHIISTKTTEGVLVTDLSNVSGSGYNVYYIEDENDLFMYGDPEGTGTNDWISLSLMSEGLTFKGSIPVVSEDAEDGYYITNSWTNYYKASGDLSITSNSTYDVRDKESVTVNVPIPTGYVKPSGTISIDSNGTKTVTSYKYAEVNVPQPNPWETTGSPYGSEAGKVYKYTGEDMTSGVPYPNDTTPNISSYIKGELYITEDSTLVGYMGRRLAPVYLESIYTDLEEPLIMTKGDFKELQFNIMRVYSDGRIIPHPTGGSYTYLYNMVNAGNSRGTHTIGVKFYDYTGDYAETSFYLLTVADTNYITFTIDGIPYAADTGATWEDWYVSGYNSCDFGTISYYVESETNIVKQYSTGAVVIDAMGATVYGTDTITAGGAYTTKVVNTISGIWTANEKVTAMESAGQYFVNFTVEDSAYFATAGSGTYYGMGFDATENACVYFYHGDKIDTANSVKVQAYNTRWIGKNPPVLNFGDTPQEVDAVLSNWLNANGKFS